MTKITVDKIAIIIPVFNRKHFTIECIRSIEAQTAGRCSVYVFDDGSTDGTRSELENRFPWVRILEGDGNFWWTASVNAAISRAMQDGMRYLITMNNDLILDTHCIENLLLYAEENPDSIIGCAGYDINDRSNLIQYGMNINWATAKRKKPTFNNNQNIVNAQVLPGRGLLFSADAFKAVGGFDHKSFPQCVADYDFILRAGKKGYRPICALDAKVYFFTEETGSIKFRKERSFISFFTSRRSAANIGFRIRFALRHCPPILLPGHIVMDLFRVGFSFWKK